MKQFAWVLLVAASLAGCASDDPAPRAESFDLETYLYDYPGWETAVEGFEHGWLILVTNPTAAPLEFIVLPVGIANTTIGMASQSAWQRSILAEDRPGPAPHFVLPAGASRLLMLNVHEYREAEGEAGLQFSQLSRDGNDPPGTVLGRSLLLRNVTVLADPDPVAPGNHVKTATVGVWWNGTSFYTNIAALNDDPAFPAGYDRSDFGGDPLPIYVYDQDRTEQPPGSKDQCYFTTITGYNELLQTQAASTSAITFMRPEDAYTQPGGEEHPLYGHSLVFLNTVIANEGPVSPTDTPPQPTAGCFDPANSIPGVPPPPRLA